MAGQWNLSIDRSYFFIVQMIDILVILPGTKVLIHKILIRKISIYISTGTKVHIYGMMKRGGTVVPVQRQE